MIRPQVPEARSQKTEIRKQSTAIGPRTGLAVFSRCSARWNLASGFWLLISGFRFLLFSMAPITERLVFRPTATAELGDTGMLPRRPRDFVTVRVSHHDRATHGDGSVRLDENFNPVVGWLGHGEPARGEQIARDSGARRTAHSALVILTLVPYVRMGPPSAFRKPPAQFGPVVTEPIDRLLVSAEHGDARPV